MDDFRFFKRIKTDRDQKPSTEKRKRRVENRTKTLILLSQIAKLLSEFAYFYYIHYLLVMVNGRRRRPAHYPLNIRHHGYSSKELSNAIKFKRFIAVFLMEYFQYPTALLLESILACLIGILIVNGNRLAVNPTFVRVNRFLVSSHSKHYYLR